MENHKTFIPDPLELVKPKLFEVIKPLAKEYRDVVEMLLNKGVSFVYSDTDSMAVSIKGGVSKDELIRFVEFVNKVVQQLFGKHFVMELDDVLSEKLAKGEVPVYDAMIIAKQKYGRAPSKKSYILVAGDEVILKGIFFKIQAIDAIKDVKTELIARAVKEKWSARRLEEECLNIIRSAPIQKLFFVKTVRTDFRREDGGLKTISRPEHYALLVRIAQLFRNTRFVRHIARDRCRYNIGELCGVVMIDPSIQFEVPAIDLRYLVVSKGRNRVKLLMLDEPKECSAICFECDVQKPPRKKLPDGRVVDGAIVEGWYRIFATCRKVEVSREKLELLAWMNTREFVETLDAILLTPMKSSTLF